VEGSLLSVLDFTVTPMGKRLIRQWVSKPLLNLKQINQRLSAVQHLLDQGVLRAELRAALRSLGDLERMAIRVVSGHALPRDLQPSVSRCARCLRSKNYFMEPTTRSPLPCAA
jgi:DNA mismatch repair protein MutS